MKAFTVYQPYAHAIVAGVKHYETRPRRTHIRAASLSTPGGWTKCRRQSI